MKLHWGNALVLFFAVFLSLAAIFIVFAMRQNNDLVTDDYYEKGAAYSAQIEINRRSVQFTDSVQIKNGATHVEFIFCNTIREYTPKIKLHFYRPSGQLADFNAEFSTADTLFLIDKANLAKGRYIVKISWESKELQYHLEKNYFVE